MAYTKCELAKGGKGSEVKRREVKAKGVDILCVPLITERRLWEMENGKREIGTSSTVVVAQEAPQEEAAD